MRFIQEDKTSRSQSWALNPSQAVDCVHFLTYHEAIPNRWGQSHRLDTDIDKDIDIDMIFSSMKQR